MQLMSDAVTQKSLEIPAFTGPSASPKLDCTSGDAATLKPANDNSALSDEFWDSDPVLMLAEALGYPRHTVFC
jgi:hypothetical protein